MRNPLSLTPVLFAIFACGDAGSGTSTDAGTSTASTTSSTTDEPTTGSSTALTTTAATTGTGTTGTTGTTDPGTTTTTTDPGTTTDGTTTGTTGDTSTGGMGNIEYAAFFVPGGLDRIVVRKANFDADLCTSVVFVWPMPNIQPDLFVPEMWSFQDAEIAQGTTDCLDFMGGLPDAVAALDVSGTTDWPSPGACSGNVDIDATLLFPQDMPWVPAQDSLTATDLPLQGC